MRHSRRNFFVALAAAGLATAQKKRNMIVRSARPEDLEMPLDGFATWITPNDRFFVRTHVYVPKVELAAWRLQIEGEVQRPLTFTMAELKALPRVELAGVLECAGNGRGFYEPPVPGLQWTDGAVGNARWAGVRLAGLLQKAGLKETAREVLLDGADVPIGTMPDFQRSIPVKKALDQDTLLAYEMNGEPLPASHGFPLRLVVPGWAGDSWTKWVTRIRVLDKEADTFWMKTAYRHPGRPVVPGSAVDAAQMRPVAALRVKSVISSPADGFRTAGGAVRVSGVAWSGEAPVSTVEISGDRGRTWQPARLGRDQSRYGWRLWEAQWSAPGPGHYILMARARDASGDTQPLVQEWNPSGYLWNVVPQVAVTVGDAPAATAAAAEAAQPQMPAGFRSACLTCHQADVMEQQRLTRAQWDREINKMTGWGAQVKPESRSEILDYLVRRFGPRPRR